MTDSESQPPGEQRQWDRLLSLVWWLLTSLLVLCPIVGTAALLAYPVMLFNRAETVGRFAKLGIDPSALPWIGALGVLVAVAMALTFLFLRHLRRIIASVAEDRPFDPANAGRLLAMAWLTIAIQLVAVPMTRLIVWFDALPFKPNVHHNSDGVQIGGIVLTLVLFVLARVFREGTRLRDDMAGMI